MVDMAFFVIISYHLVWLGFELFESLKFMFIIIGCSFTFARKGYENHHCHNKPPTGNEAGVWMAQAHLKMLFTKWVKKSYIYVCVCECVCMFNRYVWRGFGIK